MESVLARQEAGGPQEARVVAKFRLLPGGAETELQPVPTQRNGLNALYANHEISKDYPLLTAEQEVVLGRLVQAGMAAENDLVAQYHNLSFEKFDAQMAEALPVIEAGRAAKQKFINSNLGLVLKEAFRYYLGHPMGQRFGKDDLEQEGTFGLIRAVEKFDPEMGFKFSTFGTLWIRQALQRALQDKGSTIRIPVYFDEPLKKLARLETQNKSDAEIQKTLEINASELHNLRVVNTIRFSTSLDLPVSEDKDATLGTLIADPMSESEYTEVLEEQATDPQVDEIEAAQDEAGLLGTIHSLAGEKGVAIYKKIMADEELTDTELRYKAKLTTLFKHPAVRACLKEFDPDPETDWRDEAACIGYAGIYSAPGSPADRRANKSFRVNNCIGCVVRSQCRLYFAENRPERGYYSGSLSKESLLARKRRKNQREAVTTTP